MKYLLVSALIASPLFISTPSHAEDGKNYNASSCIAYSGDGKRLSYSNIYNTSSSQVLRTDCVATKDSIGHTIRSGWIEVRDLSSNEDVSCTLISHYNVVGSTTGRIWSQNRRTSGINSNWQRLNYSGLGAASNGHYYYSCSLPRRTSNGVSWLGTYQISEND
ncbi:hypothetical protein [Pleionea sediminis]|uniref:hypothetical protein n=1 Tax=Pleionea sediminis TaxID=2569479 RepID=UPI0011870ABC|nr:hypothetical protein [Pleionea sediminis]